MGNSLNRTLMALAERAETAGLRDARFRQRFHVMPPVGWMNDPNGLCQFDGVFHAYFQYAPFDARGGFVFWGHATSRDLLHWEYGRAAIAPDTPYDCHGAYSGCAVVHDGRVTMLYTGNVKLPNADGTFDYVNAGRVANTLMTETADGSTFGEKRLLMTNADYPADDTCHVRDPYVWRDNDTGRYLMLQGARRHGEGPVRETAFTSMHGAGAGTDVGEALVFASDDLLSWELVNRVSTSERFGFMWECPGYVELRAGEGAPLNVLSVSPQGLEGDPWDRRNIYQAGYFPLGGDIAGTCALGDFRLWDAGFDFYAPQIFRAEDGRAILIGWMGMPNDEHGYGNDPTVERGWQHCMTLPRELSAGADGCVLQTPVRELETLRGDLIEGEGSLSRKPGEAFDIEIDGIEGACTVLLHGGLSIAWLSPEIAEDGAMLPARLELRFIDVEPGDRSGIGCGRTVRWEPLDHLENLRIVADASSVEVFANGGSLVMSTRCYPQTYGVEAAAPSARIRVWSLGL